MRGDEKFRVGQLVRCVRKESDSSPVTRGEIYRVCGVGLHVDVETLGGEYVQPEFPTGRRTWQDISKGRPGHCFSVMTFEPLSGAEES
jgi:hypothetical protein